MLVVVPRLRSRRDRRHQRRLRDRQRSSADPDSPNSIDRRGATDLRRPCGRYRLLTWAPTTSSRRSGPWVWSPSSSPNRASRSASCSPRQVAAVHCGPAGEPGAPEPSRPAHRLRASGDRGRTGRLHARSADRSRPVGPTRRPVHSTKSPATRSGVLRSSRTGDGRVGSLPAGGSYVHPDCSREWPGCSSQPLSPTTLVGGVLYPGCFLLLVYAGTHRCRHRQLFTAHRHGDRPRVRSSRALPTRPVSALQPCQSTSRLGQG